MSSLPRFRRILAHFLTIAALLLAIAPGGAPSLAQTVTPPTATTALPTATNVPPTATTAPPTATTVPPTATTAPPTPTNTAPPPTETPSPTATANPFPTEPGTPGVPPNNPPRQERPPATQPPDERDIFCRPVGDATPLIPGSEDWSLYTCSIPLDFGKVEALTVTAKASSPGWSLILLDPATRDTPGLLEASNNRIDFDQLTTRTSVDVILGVRTSCTALAVTGVSFALRGTTPDDDRTVTAKGVATLEARSNVPLLTPTVNATDGTIDVAYSGASTTCGWQLLISMDGEIDPDAEIEVDAPAGSHTSSLPGVISILVPAGDASGTITIATGANLSEVDALFVEAYPAP